MGTQSTETHLHHSRLTLSRPAPTNLPNASLQSLRPRPALPLLNSPATPEASRRGTDYGAAGWSPCLTPTHSEPCALLSFLSLLGYPNSSPCFSWPRGPCQARLLGLSSRTVLCERHVSHGHFGASAITVLPLVHSNRLLASLDCTGRLEVAFKELIPSDLK